MAQGQGRVSGLKSAERVGLFRTLLPFARPSRRFFLVGCLAAGGVVAGRLALPWPLRVVADRWVSEPTADRGLVTAVLPDTSDYVLAMGGIFLLIILLLGLFDSLERLHFARFAAGFVRDLRTQAFWSALCIRRTDPGALSALAKAEAAVIEDAEDDEADQGAEVSAGSGDLVARLVGDSGRVKSGLQGVLVHVATNGVVFLGVVLILCAMDPYLGLVFAVAGLATMLVTFWAARSTFRRSFSQRQKEGALAEQISQTFRGNPGDAKFVNFSKSSASGDSETSQTKTQGIATWSAHAFFGTAVLAALWVGTAAVDDGRIAVGDILMMMMYALMMRGPTVRLAHQGAKTGKVLGAARRLVQMLEIERDLAAKLPVAESISTPGKEPREPQNIAS